MDPRGMVDRIYKEDHYTLLLTTYETYCGLMRSFTVKIRKDSNQYLQLHVFTYCYGCFIRAKFLTFSKFGRGWNRTCIYNTLRYGHIRKRYELLRI